MNGNEIDMHVRATHRSERDLSAGSTFTKGDPGSCMYIVQSGVPRW